MRMGWMIGPLLLGSSLGCTPVESDLYGTWAAIDEGVVRVFIFEEVGTTEELAGLDDAYLLYYYPEGSDPELAQRGTFAILEGEGPELVTSVTWDYQDLYAGQDYANRLLSVSRSAFVIEVGDGGERVYSAVSELP